MNRERLAWLLSVLLLGVVALHSPSAAQRDSDYLFVRTLVDIQRQVAANYVDPVDESKLEQAAIDGMLNQLDPFTNYVPPARSEDFDRMLEGTFKGIGVELNQTETGQIEIVTPIDGSPAYKAGVLAGDIILKVNGESIEGLRRADVVKKIADTPQDAEVRLRVKHESGEEADLAMKRQEIVLPTIKGYQRKQDGNWDWYVCDNPKIAYVRITQFTPTTFTNVRDTLTDLLKQGMSGLILDLRWNPGGQLDQAVEVVDLFISEGTIVSTKGRNRPEDIKVAHAAGTLPWFPMIVLVNEHSASAAEIVAGSLMDNKRAAVLGERSYGKGSVQEVIRLEGDNGELKLTVAYYYLPSGRLVHHKKGATTWGVEPQISVPMDEATERKVADERLSQEKFKRAATKPTTKATNPATQPIDTQLQRAVDTLILMTVLQSQPGAPPPVTGPTTRPVAKE
jgi:carboxyl-terminal processing protease